MTVTAPVLPAATSTTSRSRTRTRRPGILRKAWIVDFLDVPGIQQFYSFVTTLVSNAITAGVGSGLYGVDDPTLRQQMAVFLLKGTPRHLLRAAPVHGDLFGRPLPLDLRQLDRGSGRRGNHGRLRRRQLLPAEPRAARPDGRLPAEDQVRPELRAAGLHRRLPRRRVPVARSPTGSSSSPRRQITGGCGGGNYCPGSNESRAARWRCSSTRRSSSQ